MQNTTKKRKIEKLTQNLINDYEIKHPITYNDLVDLANSMDLSIEEMSFKNDHDGVLVCYKNRFIIFLNTNPIHHKSEHRKAFTLAHELGHYLIPEHKKKIKYEGGYLSDIGYNSNDEMEWEANYFAACLLMPRDDFKQQFGSGFSVKSLENVAKYFQVSYTASFYRFLDLEIYPVCVFTIQNNVIKNIQASLNFPYWYRNLKGMNVPNESLASEYSKLSFGTNNDVREINPYLWLESKKEDYQDYEAKVYEYFFKLDDDHFIVVIWEN